MSKKKEEATEEVTITEVAPQEATYDSGSDEVDYSFTDYGLTVKAKNIKQARERLKDILEKRRQSNG